MCDCKQADQRGCFGSWPYPIVQAILAVVIWSATKAPITGLFLQFNNELSLKG
jgi:hypothetical protein